jgi:hypothetical protein
MKTSSGVIRKNSPRVLRKKSPGVLKKNSHGVLCGPEEDLIWSTGTPIQNYVCPGLHLQNSPGPGAEFIWSTDTLLSKNKNVLDSSYRTHLVQKQNSFGPQELSCPKLRMSWTPATELTWSRSSLHLVHRNSPVQN